MCSPSHGTRVSGPSAMADSLTGLPGTSIGSATPSGAGHLDQHVAGCDVGVADDLGRGEAGARSQPGGAELAAAASSLVREEAHSSIAARTSSALSIQPPDVAKRGSSFHSGRPITSASATNCCARTDLQDEVAVAGGERVDDGLDLRLDRAVDAHGPQVGHDVGHRHHGVEHGDVDRAGLDPCASRWRRAARTPIVAEQRRADVAEGADGVGRGGSARLAPVLVDARHRLDDRRVGGPRAGTACRGVLPKPGQRQVDDAGVHARPRRRSRGPAGPSCRP